MPKKHKQAQEVGGVFDDWIDDGSFAFASGRSNSPVSIPPSTDHEDSSDGGHGAEFTSFADDGDFLEAPGEGMDSLAGDSGSQLSMKMTHMTSGRYSRPTCESS